MHFLLVTAPSPRYLAAVRHVLDSADDALVCVAFAQPGGVHLVTKELEQVAQRGTARVVVTTVFGRRTDTSAALSALTNHRVQVRTLNPGAVTYHPKVFLGRQGDSIKAVVGSANLTRGLVGNVEAGTAFEGMLQQPVIAELWDWAEAIWDDPRVAPWYSPSEPAAQELLDAELLNLVENAVAQNPLVYTLGPTPMPNYIREMNPSGLWVETERSRKKHAELGSAVAQYVPASMLNLAWDTLRARGTLTNPELRKELRVHRSSFVCGLLARLPGVVCEAVRGIELRYVGNRA